MHVRDRDPGALVADVVAYAGFLTRNARLKPGDFPDEALWILHADRYRRQAGNCGHADFIARAEHELDDILADVVRVLRLSAAAPYHRIATRLQGWIADNRAIASDLTGDDDDDDIPFLSEIDGDLRNLEAGCLLQAALAAWIASLDCLETVADDDWLPRLRAALPADRHSRERYEQGALSEIAHFLNNPAHVGFGMAAAGATPPEPILRLGGARRLTAAADGQRARWLRTTSGPRFGVHSKQGFALHEAIPASGAEGMDGAHSDQPRTGLTRRHDRLDDLFFHHPHVLGRQVALVSSDRVRKALDTLRQLDAARAIFRLLERLPVPASATALSVHRLGMRPDGTPEIVVMIVADAARRAFSAVIAQEGARLLSEPDHAALVSLTRAEIDAPAPETTPL